MEGLSLHISSRAWSFESELLTPEEVEKKFPYLHTADLYGALWVAKDGFLEPEATYSAVLAHATKQGGFAFAFMYAWR